VLVAVVAVAAIAIAGFVVSRDEGDGSDPRSAAVDEGGDLTIEQHTGPYRIVYLLEDPSGEIADETDRIWVRPPFESRLETAQGEPPGGDTVSIQIGTIDRLRIGGVDDALTIARVPALAPSTIRIVPVLDAALDAGLLEERGEREVIGRRCRVYRSGTTFGAGPLKPISREEHADTCVDADGLILEETLFTYGEPILRRIAVAVDLDPEVEDDLFDAGAISAPVDKGGGATTLAEPDSAPEGPFHVLPGGAVPEGFEHVGRYSVIPPQPERFADEAQRDGIIAGVADVHRNDRGDVFVVYQGATLGGVEAFPPVPFAEPVETTAFGDGELLLSALGSEVRFVPSAGRFVHVFGTLAPDELVAIAEGLEETTGTGLVLQEG
jgi:hypothetical protein